MYLTTQRLLLREFEEDDWQAVFAYQADELYLRYTPWTQRSEFDARQFVHMFMQWGREQPRRRYQFAIILMDEQRLIGNCGIRSSERRVWEADLGYELDSNYWGRGYATEAAQALLAFGFRDVGLHRIYAQCVTENVASSRVMQKIGMSYEGRLRDHEWMKGRWWDVFQFSVLDYEWRTKLLEEQRSK